MKIWRRLRRNHLENQLIEVVLTADFLRLRPESDTKTAAAMATKARRDLPKRLRPKPAELAELASTAAWFVYTRRRLELRQKAEAWAACHPGEMPDIDAFMAQVAAASERT